MILDVVNWDNFRVIFGLYFVFQIYRLASYLLRKPANLKGNFLVRCLGLQRGGDSALCCPHQLCGRLMNLTRFPFRRHPPLP